jgi:hypothetical protein
LQLSQLEEFRNEAYENELIYWDIIKKWHEKHVLRHDFKPKQQVLLYNSCLKIFLGKLSLGGLVLSQSLVYSHLALLGCLWKMTLNSM